MIKRWINISLAPIWLGFLFWVMIIFNWLPFSIFSLNHVQILILSAPLFLIPITIKKESEPQTLVWANLVTALFIVFSFYLEQGFIAGLMVLPWLLFCLTLFFRAISQMIWPSLVQMKAIIKLISLMYLVIGAMWLVADRFDFQPLGFDPTIVLLTVAHFHFAGYLLLQITSWVIHKSHSKVLNVLSWLVALGIPLVAIGITTTHWAFLIGSKLFL